MSAAYTIGVDVGTGSARAGVFDLNGDLRAEAKTDIAIFREAGAIVEQSSANIWSAVCRSVRQALADSGVAREAVVGLGFDATCSLVVLGPGGASLPVGPSGDPARDVIVWMDHRALAQAERINAGSHEVLKYVGGRISPEMETPKLLWLAENMPETFAAAWQFFDLSDFLTWRTTGSLTRSTCTLACKWTYLAHERRFDPAYFRAIGLGVLADEGFSRIGAATAEPGVALGAGLTAEAAAELGLRPGVPVAAALIDAHAGGLGTVGAVGAPEENLGYVFGTSSCTMTTTREPRFVPGVWGPYYAAMTPGAWLLEGGQSAAGAAIDRLLAMHPESRAAQARAAEQNLSLAAFLAAQIDLADGDISGAVTRAAGLIVVPEFLGNRAPFADPHARAIIAGLGMSTDFESLIALYVAGLCGIGYGLRQIIEAQDNAGVAIQRIIISGGAGQSRLVRQMLADAAHRDVVSVDSDQPVLLGSAMLGAVAGGVYADLNKAMAAMSSAKETFSPTNNSALVDMHLRNYVAYEALQGVYRDLLKRSADLRETKQDGTRSESGSV